MFGLTTMNRFSSRNVSDLRTLASQSLRSSEEEKLNNAKLSDLHTAEELLRNISLKDEDMVDGNENRQMESEDTCGRYVRSPFHMMKHESHRLKSYHGKWPLKTVDPLDLANVGLFYFDNEDRVQCAFCRFIISHWDETDIPLQGHQKHFPTCPFLLGYDVGNVPMTDQNGFLKWQVLFPHQPVVNSARKSTDLMPKHPHMGHWGKLLETYHNWTSTILGQQELAKCGLFYTGIGDTVTCFCCGIQLSNWVPGDDPWVKHAKHSSMCAYVRLVKGDRFIIIARQNMPSSLIPSSIDYGQIYGTPSTLQALQNGMANGVSQSAPVANISSTSTTQIQSQNGQSEEESKYRCGICYGDELRVVFLPCKHCYNCKKCAVNLVDCPLCRERIDSFFPIYIA